MNPNPGSVTSVDVVSVLVGTPVSGHRVAHNVAARFLDQAAFGPDAASIAQVQAVGLQTYLNEQFAAPISPYPDPSATGFGIGTSASSFFVNAVHGQDQLRQRVAFALSQIFVASVWGPFEARLQQPDVVILGSLNDGTWPEAADPGPWLNRPMRAGAGAAVAGGAHRRRGARLHVAARRRARLSHARRTRSTACRPCRRAGCCGCRPCLPASAYATARPTSRGSAGRARATRIGPPRPVRAPEPRPPARPASAPAQRDHASRTGSPTPTPSSPSSILGLGAAAAAGPASPMRPCAGRSCTSAEPFREASSRARCRPTPAPS